MGKYENIEKDIFSVFASQAWTAENIKVFPSNISASGDEFLKLTVLCAENEYNIVRGILMVDIYVSVGKGPNRISIIADKLDTFLAKKSLKTVGNNTTQFFESSLRHIGIDKDNPALYRATYSLQYNFYGV